MRPAFRGRLPHDRLPGGALSGGARDSRTVPDPATTRRAEQLLGAPVGRRLLAGLAGVTFPSLLDELSVPLPPTLARLVRDSPPHRGRRRHAPRRVGGRVHLDPLRRRASAHRTGARDHRRALEVSGGDAAAAVRRLRETPANHRRVDPATTAAVLRALADAVFDVGFSGNEEEYDLLLREAEDELRPVATALVRAPAAAWWWEGVLGADQRYLCRRRSGEPGGAAERPPSPEEVARRLEAATDVLRKEEADARQRYPTPDSVPEQASGSWWSVPARLLFTSRPLPPLPALELGCSEDPGEDPALVWSLRVPESARVFEVREPDDWAALVGVAPLEVTMSRMGDWRRWTGKDGPFYLPDWVALRASYDLVHLTVGGYLSTRSLPVPVVDGYSVLGGWDPDVSLWLHGDADEVRRVGEWSGRPGPEAWG